MFTQEDIDNLVTAFNDSFLAVFFPNIEGTAGQQLLESIAEYTLSCFGGVFDNCPKIWFQFATHQIALTLVNWNLVITQDSIVIQTPTPTSDVQTFLKSRKIGEKTCTFEQSKRPFASGNPPSVAWKMKVDDLYAKCKMAQQPIFMGGGSNWPERVDDCGCEKKSTMSRKLCGV